MVVSIGHAIEVRDDAVNWEVRTRVTLLQSGIPSMSDVVLDIVATIGRPGPNRCSGRPSFVCCTPERRGASELSAALRRLGNRSAEGLSRERQQRNRGAAGFRRPRRLVHTLQVAKHVDKQVAEDDRNSRAPRDL